MSLILCPPQPCQTIPLSTALEVGFGVVIVSRNGKPVWSGDNGRVRLRRFELKARKQRGGWTVEFYGPLASSKYKRQRGQWVLVQKGLGFA